MNSSSGSDVSPNLDDTAVHGGSNRAIHGASLRQPPEVATVDAGLTLQRDRAETMKSDSVEYDPSIWDFLSPALSKDDDDEEEEKEDEDDDDDGADGDSSSDGGTYARLRSPHKVNNRSAEHAQAVLEIVETEISYGKDLAIIKRVRK